MSDRILLFIPCYNCAPQIGRTLMQLRDMPVGLISEALVVDNRSADGTIEAARSAASQLTTPIRIVRNRHNYSLGGSHKVAFDYATRGGFTHVVVLHGDDQGDLRDLLPILSEGLHRSYDACLGARFMRGSRLQNYSAVRILGNHAFNALFSVISGRRVRDLGSGLNIFARTLFSSGFFHRYADDLRFNVYLLLGMVDASRRIMFFPISWREADQVSNVDLLPQARKTLAVAAEYLLNRRLFRARDHRAARHERYECEAVP